MGLDPDPSRIPDHLVQELGIESAVTSFCREIIRETSPFAIAFKINFAFFEALGDQGFSVMRSVMDALPGDVLTIADAKRGDIGNSAAFYARSVFDNFGYDSVTISPYMGRDSVTPFLQYPGTCTFVLTRTSNPGGSDFQTLQTESGPLFTHLANEAVSWSDGEVGETGLVVGASDIDALQTLRVSHPSTPFLVPGVGAQGGSASEVMSAAGNGPILVNSSRSILYASADIDFATAAGRVAEETRNILGS